MADYSKSVAEAAAVVDSQEEQDSNEENLVQLKSNIRRGGPPRSMLLQVKEEANSLVSQLSKLNLTPDQL